MHYLIACQTDTSDTYTMKFKCNNFINCMRKNDINNLPGSIVKQPVTIL